MSRDSPPSAFPASADAGSTVTGGPETLADSEALGRRLGQARVAANSASALARHPPFDRLSGETLALLAARAELVHFPRGADIVSPQSGVTTHLHVVDQGTIRVEDGMGEGDARDLGPGDCFPLAAIIARRPADFTYTGRGECYCRRIPAADIEQALSQCAAFAAWWLDWLAKGLCETRQDLRTLSARRGEELRRLHAPLSSLVNQPPLALEADATVRTAMEEMAARGVGSVVVIDAQRRPCGIVTRSDALDRVVIAGLPMETPLREIMTRSPSQLSHSATAYDAMRDMGRAGLRRLVVVDDEGRVAGVVSNRDILGVQNESGWQLRRVIAAAPTVSALAEAAESVRRLARGLLTQGVAPAQLTQFISALNDALTVRILELNLDRHDLFGVDWCWLAFGSEGRSEQTFSTDQDNGIIFFCDDFSDRDQLRLRLVDFARDVNRDLDLCGFPLCPGNIMAGNPDWCLTIEEWEERFTAWVRSPEPTALLHATIFFDFRPLFGRGDFAARLRRHLLDLTTSTPLFLRAMAGNALDVEPPLGTFRDFRDDLDPQNPGTLDLKKYGSRLFVDGARILALAAGVHAAGTAERLRLAGTRLNMRPADVAAIIEGFQFIQGLRLRLQEGSGGYPPDANLLAPETLNEMQRQILKESLRQAKKLQLRLRLDYQAR